MTLLARPAAVCVFTVGVLLASDPLTRDVKGSVHDQYGHALGGAVVQIQDTRTLQIRSFITQRSGEFHFAGMSTDKDYELKAKYRSTWGKPHFLSRFNTDSPAVVELTVKLEGARNEAPK